MMFFVSTLFFYYVIISSLIKTSDVRRNVSTEKNGWLEPNVLELVAERFETLSTEKLLTKINV